MRASDSAGDERKQQSECDLLHEGDVNADDTKESRAEPKRMRRRRTKKKPIEGSDKSSYPLHIGKFPNNVEMSKTDTRHSRHGDVVSADGAL